MKKILFGSLAAGIILVNVISVLPKTAYSLPIVPVCKVEVIDCPGWGTGDRQICHENATGLTCTCGQSTNCPPED